MTFYSSLHILAIVLGAVTEILCTYGKGRITPCVFSLLSFLLPPILTNFRQYLLDSYVSTLLLLSAGAPRKGEMFQTPFDFSTPTEHASSDIMPK